MGEHRDDSKAEFPEGRTGVNDGGMTSKVSRPDDEDARAGTWGRPEGHGLSPVPTDDEVPAEEATFSESGGTGTQPGLAKRTATDETQDMGHLDRADLHGKQPDDHMRDRGRGNKEHGAG